MAETIYNGNLDKLGGKASGWIPLKPTDGTLGDVRHRTESELFEQLLLFDKISVRVGRENFGLTFLIQHFGYKGVRDMLESDLLELLLWTPVLVTSPGRKLEDGTIDHSVVFGTPPLITGTFQADDVDPEINIERALGRFQIDRAAKRALKRAAIDKYVLPDARISSDAKNYVLDAYTGGKLKNLGLPNNKSPDQLDHVERQKLLELGGKVLDTTILSQNNYTSFEQTDHLLIAKDSINAISQALKVSGNTEKILELENIPDLRNLYTQQKLSLARVLDLRKKRSVKEYRKWIQSVSKKEDSLSISKEYIDEITGKNKLIESTAGKFLKNIALFGIGTGLGAALGGIGGAAVGGVIAKTGEFGLGLLDTYLLDGLLKGWNPRMFVRELEKLKDSK